MLIDLIMESFLNMDDEEKSIAIESMSPEEIDLVNDYIDTISDPEVILESIYEILDSMDDDTLVATLESFTDDELDFIVANESIFGKRNSSVADRRIAKAIKKQNEDSTAKTDSAIDKAAKVSDVLHKDLGVAASNVAYNLKKKIRGISTPDPVADVRAERKEIAQKLNELNKRGDELRRPRTI